MIQDSIVKNLVLNTDEQIARVVRQSSWRLTTNTSWPIILIILIFFLFYPLFRLGIWGKAIFFVLLCFSLGWLGRAIIRWYFTSLVITNQRLIDLDQRGFFARVVSELTLNKIDEVICQTNGLIGAVGKLGQVIITALNSPTKIIAADVYQPQQLQQLILRLRDEQTQNALNKNQLTAEELVNLVKKIKTNLGEENFRRVISESSGDK